MSSATAPISPTRFAEALTSLPLDALHSKAAELRNSLAHLRHSNSEMLPFAEAGDEDCKEAMFENLGVIGRMNERLELLRVEVVEKRGMPWGQEESEEEKADQAVVVNGVSGQRDGEQAQRQAPSGRLTDEELRQRMEEQLAGEDEEEGVHL